VKGKGSRILKGLGVEVRGVGVEVRGEG
jgi:hypothetical protein